MKNSDLPLETLEHVIVSYNQRHPAIFTRRPSWEEGGHLKLVVKSRQSHLWKENKLLRDGMSGMQQGQLAHRKTCIFNGREKPWETKKKGYPATPKTARMMWDDHFRLWNSVHNCNLGASPCRQPSNWPALLPPGLCCIDHQHCARLTDVLQDGVENRQEVHGTPSLRIFIVVNGIQWACGTTQGWKRANAPCKILVWAVWGQNPKPWADKIWWLCVLLTIQLYSLGHPIWRNENMEYMLCIVIREPSTSIMEDRLQVPENAWWPRSVRISSSLHFFQVPF